MKSIKLALALVVALSAANTALAADRSFTEMYVECGFGAVVNRVFLFDTMEGAEPFAVIVNLFTMSGGLATTSGFTTPRLCLGGRAEMAKFIIETHPQIEQNLSVGSGTHLSSMMTMMGCGDNSAAATNALRAEFGKSIVEDGYYESDQLGKSELLFNAAVDVSTQYCTV